jgi:hypothetical protein
VHKEIQLNRVTVLSVRSMYPASASAVGQRLAPAGDAAGQPRVAALTGSAALGGCSRPNPASTTVASAINHQEEFL